MRPSSIRELLTDWVKQCEKSWVENKREGNFIVSISYPAEWNILNPKDKNILPNNLETELGDINDYKILTN